MTTQPIILIHGYSSKGDAFNVWREILRKKGFSNTHVVSWQSLVNEINIPDIAEGFDRALRVNAKLEPDEVFDCIVHSTGMLVIREWLINNPERIHQLKRLIALAPATFGSPVAKKGRSFLGSIVKGNREIGPDFLEAGDQILDSLELASPYTWNLAHQDLFGETTYYGKNSKTPYVFTFCGDKAGFFSKHIAGKGSDGVVRISGASLNTRKIILDFTHKKKLTKLQRADLSKFTHIDSPVVPVKGADHGSIIDNPDRKLINLVIEALTVKSKPAFDTWHQKAATTWWSSESRKPQYQQLFVRATDERGVGIHDYAIKLYTKKNNRFYALEAFEDEVKTYSKDPSFRSFQFDLKKIKPNELNNLWIKVVLASDTKYVGYTGYDGNNAPLQCIPNERGLSELNLEITKLLKKRDFTLFYPRTTTLLEMVFERQPLPLNQHQEARIAVFDD